VKSIYSAKSRNFHQNFPEKYKYHPKKKHATIAEEKEEEVKCEIFKTPDFTAISGYASRKFEIIQAGKLVEEIWVSENLKEYVNYELNLELYQDFMRTYIHQSESKLYCHLSSFMEIVQNGFPMKIRMCQNDTITETRVETLIKKRLDDSVFLVPKNYEECQLKDIL
jgi:hypothetical protein